MLALDDYEAAICPGCGLPLEVCRNGEFQIDHEARVCWGSAHRAIAVKQWREEHPKDANGDHLMTMLTLKTEER